MCTRDAALIVDEFDKGNALYGGVHYGLKFTR